MPYCSYCGTQVAEGLAACPNCGHPQTSAPVAAVGRRTEGTAVASLILGIAGFVVCPIVPSILAIIFGNQARQKIMLDPSLDGDGMARAGIILGWVGVGIAVVGLVAIMLLVTLTPGGFDFDQSVGFDALAPFRLR